MTHGLPPSAGEIEVSLFGPGFGESVVLHIGAGQWIVVDSCIDRTLSEPTPIAYLRSIGVDIERQVTHVIASHWHDDHVRGLSAVLEACKAAKFVCASAMVAEKFQMLGELYSSKDKALGSGIGEFSRIHRLIDAEARRVVRTGPNRQLVCRSGDDSGLPFDLRLMSLSPSDEAADSAVRELAATLNAKSPVRKLAKLYPNDFSIVLQLIAGKDSILLGSDMETGAKYGWQAVVSDEARPREKSGAFKVAHHGAESGHHDPVWDEMLHPEPLVFLTPFVKGAVRLPTARDIERIKRRTKKAFITADPLANSRRRYSSSVERTIRESRYRIVPVITSRGQVRFRMTPGRPMPEAAEVFFGARPLHELR